ncbi:hypothetical protein [Reyranella sp.]|uniref:hypothetical protein n=1 Tax=Reyranella sp. TaxID=1929291 RepID=UPI003D0B2734
MTGGLGADAFAFGAALGASNIDTITDFNVAADMLRLNSAIFTALAGTGTLSLAQFAANARGTAQDASGRIIYETDTGKPFYDSNGNAAGGSIQFATLAPGLAPTPTSPSSSKGDRLGGECSHYLRFAAPGCAIRSQAGVVVQSPPRGRE